MISPLLGMRARTAFRAGPAVAGGKTYPVCSPRITPVEFAQEYEGATGDQTRVQRLSLEEARQLATVMMGESAALELTELFSYAPVPAFLPSPFCLSCWGCKFLTRLYAPNGSQLACRSPGRDDLLGGNEARRRHKLRRLGRQGVVTHTVPPEDRVQSSRSKELAHAEKPSG